MEELSPRESGKFISGVARDVKIVSTGICRIAEEIKNASKNGELGIDMYKKHELHPQTSGRSAVDWVFLVDVLNFSFWTIPEQKYSVTFKGKTYTGYFSLCAAINRALQEGIPILDPAYYCDITEDQLAHVLRSDTGVAIPLLQERLKCLHETGQVLRDKFEGSFLECVVKCNQSAQRLLKIIVESFPCFRDQAYIGGKKVSMYKRAQILVADIWCCFNGEGLGHFRDINTITMFADYRIPQVLVWFEAMEYSDNLKQKLYKGEMLENGDRLEVEIRGCSIEIVEQVAQEVGADTVNSILIDQYLWEFRRRHAGQIERCIPFHRTRCIYY